MTNIKIAFLGSVGSGKSSLINRILTDKFSEDILSTVVVDLEIWHRINQSAVYFYDVGNAYSLDTLIDKTVNNANAYCVVFDINHYQSFKHAISLLETYTTRFPQSYFYLLANKVDLGKPQVDRDTIANVLIEKNLLEMVYVHFVSAKNPKYGNIRELMQYIMPQLEPDTVSEAPVDCCCPWLYF